jgi:hypothetical protein
MNIMFAINTKGYKANRMIGFVLMGKGRVTMPDREKVIKGFECCHVMVHDLGPDKTSCGICPYKDVQTEEQIDLGGIECIAVLHDDALALLKEQEAVEPKAIRMNGFGDPVYACGKCGLLITKSMHYCHKCGKRIDWEGR